MALESTTDTEGVEIYSAGIQDDTTVFDATVVPTQETNRPVAILPRQPDPRIGVVSRSYSGQLLRSKRSIRSLRPKASYQLVSEKGRRLIWVDFDEIIMPGTIERYIGRNVLLRGEPVQDENSGDWIVYVRTIQENP